MAIGPKIKRSADALFSHQFLRSKHLHQAAAFPGCESRSCLNRRPDPNGQAALHRAGRRIKIRFLLQVHAGKQVLERHSVEIHPCDPEFKKTPEKQPLHLPVKRQIFSYRSDHFEDICLPLGPFRLDQTSFKQARQQLIDVLLERLPLDLVFLY